ncbi:class I SAM-dependent methyltransferase [Streptomyces fagopyri]|uniref:class I SAM-dependent methyltransferase n=1 Tax=Streptomyces fagopyri TaxID=2662397 RepID=UPI0036B5748A
MTASPVALGTEVLVVEPDPAMPAELRRSLPAVRTLPGSTEATPLPDASVDAVLAGNDALRWFDMTVAGPEMARVLAPGGVLAGLWNVMDDRVEWVAGLLIMPAQEQEAALGRMRAFLTGGPETAPGEFTLPILTGVLRVRRL